MRCKIIFEDEELLVIHKPAGLATQSAKVGQGDVVSEVKGYLARRSGGGPRRAPYLGIVHRLDQPVEGLLVFAKTQRAAAALTKQLQKGTLHKTYVAAVYGRPKEAEQELADYLVKDGSIVRVVTGQEKTYPDAKEARLSYRLLRTFSVTWREGTRAARDGLEGRGSEVLGYEGTQTKPDDLEKSRSEESGAEVSVLEVRLETGRFHQIRAQLSHAGMPILGDQKYGSDESQRLSEALSVRNVALCAESLEILHPATKKKMSWKLPPENKIFQNAVN